jgi:hypothetical protein
MRLRAFGRRDCSLMRLRPGVRRVYRVVGEEEACDFAGRTDTDHHCRSDADVSGRDRRRSKRVAAALALLALTGAVLLVVKDPSSSPGTSEARVSQRRQHPPSGPPITQPRAWAMPETESDSRHGPAHLPAHARLIVDRGAARGFGPRIAGGCCVVRAHASLASAVIVTQSRGLSHAGSEFGFEH